MRYLRVLRNKVLRKQVAKYIWISLAIHLVLALVIKQVPVPDRPVLKQPAYVDLLETGDLPTRPLQSPRDEQQFVRKAPAPQELLTEEEKDARFASEDEQNVIEERKARETGMTENRANDGEKAERRGARGAQSRQAQRSETKRGGRLNFAPEPLLDRVKEQMNKTANAASSSDGDVVVGRNIDRKPAQETDESSQPSQFPTVAGGAQGMSTVGEALPDSIEFGDFTALNTDRHTYYAFYARMEEQTRHRWESYVRAAIYDSDPVAREQFSNKEYWTTKLEIILDREGRFVRAIIRESSGMRTLDSAPVQAFKDAFQFPNPPEGLVKEDGQIHIMYAFSVNISSRLAAN